MIQKTKFAAVISKGLPIFLIMFLIGAAVFSLGCVDTGAKDGDTLSIYYTGTLEDGTVFDTNVGGQPFSVVLGEHTVVPGFENALYDMKVRETKTIVIQPEEAYPYDPDLIVSYEISALEESLGFVPEVGEELYRSNGIQSMKGVVLAVTETEVVVDFNSELADKVLIFDIKIASIKKGESNP